MARLGRQYPAKPISLRVIAQATTTAWPWHYYAQQAMRALVAIVRLGV